MDAELALEMGCPIYGIIALTATATDKEGRSVPAPGQGILTTAREVPSVFTSPVLKLSFRKQNLEEELHSITQWAHAQRQVVTAESKQMLSASSRSGRDGAGTAAAAFVAEHAASIDRLEAKKRAGAFDTWGQGFYRGNPAISPLRGALAVWGLGVDDIGVASFHGTSTLLNDRNESDTVNKQMTHLGRTKGASFSLFFPLFYLFFFSFFSSNFVSVWLCAVMQAESALARCIFLARLSAAQRFSAASLLLLCCHLVECDAYPLDTHAHARAVVNRQPCARRVPKVPDGTPQGSRGRVDAQRTPAGHERQHRSWQPQPRQCRC